MNAFEKLIGVRLSPFGYRVITAAAVIIIIVLVLIIRGIAGLFSGGDKEEQAAEVTTQESPAETTTEEPEMDPVSLTVSVVGDCTIGTDPSFDYEANFEAYYDAYGADYFMENVKSIFEEDDLTIANLEGTFTDSEDRGDSEYAFKGSPDYAKILSDSSIEAVNLANNHSHDFGEQGFEDTKSNLDAQNILHFGYDEVTVTEIKGVKVGLVGIYELDEHLGVEQQLKDNIAKVKEEGAQLIIVSFHWGNELDTEPDVNQRVLGRLAVDEGADLVVGHHAHVLQGIEEYKGKNIVYGLGNFCFGGNNDPTELDTMIYQQTFTITADGVQADNVNNIIPCSVSSTESYNNFQPTPAEGDEEERIRTVIEERSEAIPSSNDDTEAAEAAEEQGSSTDTSDVSDSTEEYSDSGDTEAEEDADTSEVDGQSDTQDEEEGDTDSTDAADSTYTEAAGDDTTEEDSEPSTTEETEVEEEVLQ